MNRTELSGGAGGKAASRRKRQQNQESQGLADALTEFLHNWTKPDQRRQQTKGTSKSGETSLARKLIAVLKTCLNEGSSDSEVAETLLRHLPQTQQPVVTWADAWDDQESWQEAESWSRPAKRHRHDLGDYQLQSYPKNKVTNRVKVVVKVKPEIINRCVHGLGLRVLLRNRSLNVGETLWMLEIVTYTQKHTHIGLLLALTPKSGLGMLNCASLLI